MISFMYVAPPLYMLQVFDRIFVSKNLGSLAILFAILILVYVLMGWFDYYRNILLAAVADDFEARWVEKLKNKLSIAEFSEGRQDFVALGQIKTQLFSPGIFNFFELPFAAIFFYVLFLIHPFFAVLAAFLFAIQLLLSLIQAIVESKFGENQIPLLCTETLRKKISALKEVQFKGRLPEVLNEIKIRDYNYREVLGKQNYRSSIFEGISRYLRLAATVLTVCLGAILYLQGLLTVGGFIAASLLMMRVVAPLDGVLQSFPKIKKGWNGFHLFTSRLAGFKTTSVTKLESDKSFKPSDTDDSCLILQNVNVEVGEQRILTEISGKFSAAKINVITGRSGIGKTQFLKCILAANRSPTATIQFKGLRLSSLDIVHTGFAPSDTLIFDGSVRFNISLGRDEGDARSESIRAAKVLNLHQRVLAYPNGYETELSEASSNLSANDRRLIGVARALYGTPRLLILDEPTTDLDTKSRQRLLTYLEELVKHEVIILVASHDPDLIERGKIFDLTGFTTKKQPGDENERG